MDKKFRPHYSGGLSHRFWKEINSKKGKHRWFLYSLGCSLQSLEKAIIEELNDKGRE